MHAIACLYAITCLLNIIECKISTINVIQRTTLQLVMHFLLGHNGVTGIIKDARATHNENDHYMASPVQRLICYLYLIIMFDKRHW